MARVEMKSLRSMLFVALVSTLLLWGCERDDEMPAVEPVEEAAVDEEPEFRHHDYTDIDDDKIVDLAYVDDERLVELEVGDAELFPSCREIFEENGEVLPWPVEAQKEAVTIFGCNPDGFVELHDGSRGLAYEVPIEGDERATNLRVTLYEPDGTPRWSHVMSRSGQRENFVANYRGSFLAPVDERLLCAGTRWNAGTQFFCARQESGSVVLDERVNFWAGVYPFGFDGAIFSADINGITKRYPYTGVEMRHRSFPERAGRAGYYATDQQRIFAVPSRGDTVMTAWDLAALEEIWRADLGDIPRSGYGPASIRHRLLFFSVDGTLAGVDTHTGELRMAFSVSDDTPAVVFTDDTLYLLHRRLDDPPLLYAIDPDGGDIRWAAKAPAGTLNIDYADGAILARTVRTVRKIRPVDHE